MPYTREDYDWIEAEWAFHLHGRSAFLSREDFAQLQAWEGQGLPAELLVGAMEAFFARRAKRPRPRAFIALAHLEKDVAKAAKLREALVRAGAEAGAAPADLGGWDAVAAPLGQDPQAKALFGAWRQAVAALPGPESPGYLEAFDAERRAFGALIEKAEAALGPKAEPLRAELRARLLEAKIPEASIVWTRAWAHHWARTVAEVWGIPA